MVSEPGDARAEASRQRHALVQTIGNLTILTQSLNSSTSNSEWSSKKPAIQSHSLLPINAMLQVEPNWDEDAIQRRSARLFEKALEIWPHPSGR